MPFCAASPRTQALAMESAGSASKWSPNVESSCSEPLSLRAPGRSGRGAPESARRPSIRRRPRSPAAASLGEERVELGRAPRLRHAHDRRRRSGSRARPRRACPDGGLGCVRLVVEPVLLERRAELGDDFVLRGNRSRSALAFVHLGGIKIRVDGGVGDGAAATDAPPDAARSRPQSLHSPAMSATAAAATTLILSLNYSSPRTATISSEPSSSRSTPISTWHTPSVMGSSMSSRFARTQHGCGGQPLHDLADLGGCLLGGRATRDQLARAPAGPGGSST